jgi:hypothetical protein
MQNNLQITCPRCNHTFKLEEVYRQEIEAKIIQDFDKKTADAVADATKQAVEKEKKRNEQQTDSYKRKISELSSKNLELEQKDKANQQLELQNAELQNANKKMQSDLATEIRKAVINRENELLDEKEKEKNELEKIYKEQQKRLEEQQKESEERIKKQAIEDAQRIVQLELENKLKNQEADIENKYKLQLQIKDEQLLQANKKAEELTKNLNQVSMQVQGEAQEKLLSERLKEIFTYDNFSAKTTGKEETDIEQIVVDNGRICGKIVYESKNTKVFNLDWVSKLKKDGQRANADCLVIVTQTMPSNNDKLHQIENVWICPINNFEIVAKTLRYGLVEISKQKITNENKQDKMAQLYLFMNSKEFQNYMEAIFMGIKNLKDSYEKEKNALQKLWKQREKEFANIYDNAVNFIGAIKGISGIETALFELPYQQNLLE